MPTAKLDPKTNRLSEISNRPAGPGEVPLADIPTGFGPWSYDAANQIAVPATLTAQEQLDQLVVTPRVVAALAQRLDPSWSTLAANQQAYVQGLLAPYMAALAPTLPKAALA